MKKIYLIGAILGALVFYACKKEDKTITVTNTVNDTINKTVWWSGQVDANTLTAAISVGYSTKVADSVLPSASTSADAPVLDTMYKRTYSVIEGQYLTIYPPNISGYVAGYYVQIKGASSYFKVNYSAANTQRKAARAAMRAKLAASGAKKASQLPAFVRGSGEGYIDSSIVIKLPVSIKGDTFYVKYAAYDTLNRVSKPVTATVIVLPQGSTTFNDSLAGTWNYARYRNYSTGSYDNEWTVDTLYPYTQQYYTCNNNTLTASEEATDIYLVSYAWSSHWAFTFNSQYTYSSSYSGSYRNLDLDNSTCSSYAYTYSNNYNNTETGAISYDASKHRLMFIYNNNESNNNSNLDFEYYYYYVSELTAKKLVLTYDENETSDYQYLYMYEFNK